MREDQLGDVTRVWGGVGFRSLSTLAPLVMARLFSPQSPIRFAALMTASFCLGHNAIYLFVGSLVPFDDAGRMILLGAPRWLLLALSIPLLSGFVLVLTSVVQAMGLRPADSLWKWIVTVELGLLTVPALMLVVLMFLPAERFMRLKPMLLIVSSYAVCYGVAAYRARSATVSSQSDLDNSQLRHSWRQTVGLIVSATLLIALEWLAFGPT